MPFQLLHILSCCVWNGVDRPRPASQETPAAAPGGRVRSAVFGLQSCRWQCPAQIPAAVRATRGEARAGLAHVHFFLDDQRAVCMGSPQASARPAPTSGRSPASRDAEMPSYCPGGPPSQADRVLAGLRVAWPGSRAEDPQECSVTCFCISTALASFPGGRVGWVPGLPCLLTCSL